MFQFLANIWKENGWSGFFRYNLHKGKFTLFSIMFVSFDRQTQSHSPPPSGYRTIPSPPTVHSCHFVVSPFLCLLFSVSIILPFPGCHTNRIIMQPPGSGFLYFRFRQVSGANSFILLSNIPLCGCTTVYLPIHLLEEIWLFSKFG